ncbi:Transposon Tf2-9 polyprotein, partial [Araneus ventricosus]
MKSLEVYAFVDDILIASKNPEQHFQHLKTLFARLDEYGLCINVSKRIFGTSTIDFLGFNLSENGIKPLPDKVKCILDFPKPDTLTQLQRFLGLFNFYRCFIPKAAHILAPIVQFLEGHTNKKKSRSSVCKSSEQLKWNENAEQAFIAAKNAIAEATLLRHPIPGAKLGLWVDASDVAIGGTLSRLSQGKWEPIAFFSMKLNKKFARAQKDDSDIQKFLHNDASSLQLELKPCQTSNCNLLCDTSTGVPRPFVPTSFRKLIFDHLHNLAHPGIAASTKLISARYIWPGPLPPSGGQIYLLTIIDRFSRWPEAIPIPDMRAKTVCRAIFDTWISHFGCPSVITSDQGSQLRSSMFVEFTRMLGTQKIRTTPYHPISNRIVERFHRHLKSEIKAHENEK